MEWKATREGHAVVTPRRTEFGDLVSHGIVPAGSTVVATHKGRRYSATVTPEGSGRLKVPGRPTGSLSAMAKHITGYESNGWRFWKFPQGSNEVPLITLRDDSH